MGNLLYRGIYLGLAFCAFLGFIWSVTHETGVASFYPLVIPIVGAIAINIILPKIGKSDKVKYVALVVFLAGLVFAPYGTFINYEAIGLTCFTLFFHAIRPWNI